MTMRATLESSWPNGAAASVVDEFGRIVETAATKAAELLYLADGDAQRAIAKLPSTRGMADRAVMFWARVASHLTSVAAEERASRGPILRREAV